MSDRNTPYPLTGAALEALVEDISPARFSTYLEEAGGDREGAIRLYMWNASVSAAFYFPLQALEITLRNAMHRRLSEEFGAEWYDNPAVGKKSGPGCIPRKRQKAVPGLMEGNVGDSRGEVKRFFGFFEIFSGGGWGRIGGGIRPRVRDQ